MGGRIHWGLVDPSAPHLKISSVFPSTAVVQGPSTIYSANLEAKGQSTSEAAGFNDATSKTAVFNEQKASQKRQRSSSLGQGNNVGYRFTHNWVDEDGQITHWKGTILHEVPINPSLFLVKYDGIDCVYALELQKDKRIEDLKFLPEVIQPSENPDPSFADSLIGKAVEHSFEGEDGTTDKYRGIVLDQAPFMKSWFYITYEKDPVLFIYDLAEDFKQGDLRIISEFNEAPPVHMKCPEERVGLDVKFANDDGSQSVGKVIHQVECRPNVYFIKFDDDYHIYVYNF